MKDEDRMLLLLGWGLLMVAIILMYCKVAYKLDQVSAKVDEFQGRTTVIIEETATVTDATETDAELTIEVNKPELHRWYPPTEVYQAQICQIRLANGTTEETAKETEKGAYIGSMELTAYISTGNPCADGAYPQVGRTAACNNPNLWHKWVHIEGYGDYYIHDTGGMSSNVIDIFVGSYGEAIQFGRRNAEVYIID